MRRSKLNVPLLVLTALLVGTAVVLFSSVRGASAAGPLASTATAILCMDVYTDAVPLEAKGDAPGPEDLRAAKIIWRLEPSATQVGAWDMTGQSYRLAGVTPNLPPADGCDGSESRCTDALDNDAGGADGAFNDGCVQVGATAEVICGPAVNNDPGDDTVINDGCPAAGPTKGDVGNSLDPSIEFETVNIHSRPSAIAKLSGTSLGWSSCSFQDDLGAYVQTSWNLVLGGTQKGFPAGTSNFGLQDATFYPFKNCTGTAGSSFDLVVHTVARTVTKGTPMGGAVADDWDGDGRSDWDELARVGPGSFPIGCDPFNPDDDRCGGVGGVAELPEVAGTPLESTGSGASFGLIAAIVGAIAAGTLGLTGGATWYVRRRRP